MYGPGIRRNFRPVQGYDFSFRPNLSIAAPSPFTRYLR